MLQEVVRELLSFGDHHALGRAFETLAESGTAEERAACLRAAAEQYAAADEWAAAGTLELRRAELVGDQRLATSLAERFHAAGAAELRDRARAIATLARSRPPK